MRVPPLRLALALCTGVLLCGHAAHAATIFSSGVSANDAPTFNALSSDSSVPRYTAAPFSFATEAEVAAITVQGSYSGPIVAFEQGLAEDSFTVAFLADDGGQPGAIMGAGALTPTLLGRVETTNTSAISVDPIYEYSLNLAASLTFPAGNYWLAVANDTPDPNAKSWFWASSNYPPFTDGAAAYQSTTGIAGAYSLFNFPSDLIFTLEDAALTAVPEPASISMLGLLGAIVSRRRAR